MSKTVNLWYLGFDFEGKVSREVRNELLTLDEKFNAIKLYKTYDEVVKNEFHNLWNNLTVNYESPNKLTFTLMVNNYIEVKHRSKVIAKWKVISLQTDEDKLDDYLSVF